MRKFYRLLPILMMIFHSGPSIGQSMQLDWVGQLGGINMDWVNAMEIDNNGNIYTVGFFRDTADFDPGPGVYNLNGGIPTNTMFISKLDSSGNFVWAKEFVVGQPNGNDIAIDNSGNVWVFGDFYSTTDFDPGPGTFAMTPVGYSDLFILKLDESGNFVWAGKMGGPSHDEGEFMDLDEDGNIYMMGRFSGTVDFDPGINSFNLTAQNVAIFVTKLDSTGNFINAIKLDAVGNIICHGLVADANNGIVVAGRFLDTVDFDPGPQVYQLAPMTSGDEFICHLDFAGNFNWVRTMYDGNSFFTYSVLFDSAGCNYAVGSFRDTANFDPLFSNLSLVTTGLSDCFIMKRDTSGNLLWVKGIGGTYEDRGVEIIDKNNHLYVIGNFDKLVDFDPGPGVFNMFSQPPNSTFVAELDYNGNFITANQMGPSNFSMNTEFKVGSSGTMYMAGVLQGTSDFDNGPGVHALTSFGYEDVFASRWNDCSSYAPSISAMGSTSFCLGDSVVLSADPSAITYQWYRSNILIPGAINQTYDAKQRGVYSCIIQNASSCTDTSNSILVRVPCMPHGPNHQRNLQDDETEFMDIQIAPNPAKDILNVTSGDVKLIRYEVLNLAGESVEGRNILISDFSIDTGKMSKGIYFLKLVSENDVFIKRFQVIRD